ncbi:MAG: tetratricopeptide repeat protein, partial [Bdellovibrionales bacterium]|nr:tetratricopeptide repeat protein [Bdellovibrionales bacterium]
SISQEPTSPTLPNFSPAEILALRRRPDFDACHERAEYGKAAEIALEIHDALSRENATGTIYIANLCNLAASLALSGDPKRAKEFASNAAIDVHTQKLVQDSEFIVALNNLAMVLLQLGEHDTALKTIHTALKEERTPEQEEELAIELSVALSTKASILHEREITPEAIENLERAITLLRKHPNDSARYKRTLGDRLLILGDMLCEEGRAAESLPLYEEGIALLKEALQASNIKVAVALQYFAYAQLLCGDYVRSREVASEAIQIIEEERGESDSLLFEPLLFLAISESYLSTGNEGAHILRAHHISNTFHDEPQTYQFLGAVGVALTPVGDEEFPEPISRLFMILEEEDDDPSEGHDPY